MAKKHYSVRLSEWLIEQLKIASEKRNRSVNNLIETAILDSLNLSGGRASIVPNEVKKDIEKSKTRKINEKIDEFFKD